PCARSSSTTSKRWASPSPPCRMRRPRRRLTRRAKHRSPVTRRANCPGTPSRRQTTRSLKPRRTAGSGPDTEGRFASPFKPALSPDAHGLPVGPDEDHVIDSADDVLEIVVGRILPPDQVAVGHDLASCLVLVGVDHRLVRLLG